MLIKGSLENIVFRNEENGYTVANINLDGIRIVTAVGIFPPITEGEYLSLEGEYILNTKYGDQFGVKQVEIAKPTSEYNILRYLASGLFKGIGEVTASKIVEKFGTNTLDIIEITPTRLTEVKGITHKRAMEIGDSFVKMQNMQSTIFFLQGLGLSVNFALKVFKIYDVNTESIIRKNPYRLIEDIDGIGFISADKIAEKIGIEIEGKFRICAGLYHILKEAVAKEGHTYLPKNDLLFEAEKLLELSCEQSFTEVLQEMEVLGKIVELSRGGEEIIMLSKHYATEKSISARLVTMLDDSNEIYLDLVRDIASFELEGGLTLHEGQVVAIKNSIERGVNVITGGPGTGKTTIIKCIISILKSKGMSVQLCAPTGRAAKRMSEATGLEAKTIHRLLDLDFKDGKGFFTYNESTTLDADVIIVDEVSMCDEYVFNALISAIGFGGRLIMVGDKDQLPSVGAGNVLADIIASGVIPVSYLTQIYRQGEESLIVKNAHLINAGKLPILSDNKSDFFYSGKDSAEEIRDTVVEMVTQRIPRFIGGSVKDIQTLCPMKKGASGVENLNERLQASINPPDSRKNEIKKPNGCLFREGDKVIHMVNNYQLEWKRRGEFGGEESGVGVFNGDIGYVEGVDTSKGSLEVEFEDGKLVNYPSSEISDQLKLAYAITVHKSQGSEFDVVVIPIVGGSPTICTRNLLYTALTRAKKMVVLVGSRKTVEYMVANNYTAKRYSMLADMIIEEHQRKARKNSDTINCSEKS